MALETDAGLTFSLATSSGAVMLPVSLVNRQARTLAPIAGTPVRVIISANLSSKPRCTSGSRPPVSAAGGVAGCGLRLRARHLVASCAWFGR
jgi:hypothetical protein